MEVAHMKKLTALVLILAVTLTAIPTASAAVFTDVANSSYAWAETYIDDLAERGLFTGYDDGTFRPAENIILLHTLVLVSRLYNTDDATKQLVLNEYSAFLSETLKGKGMDWAYPQLAVCLETGIVTREELAVFATSGALNKPVEKEMFAVLLAKAIQLEKEALALTEYKLPFDDYLLIKYSYWPYIYMLYTKQIILGDTQNKFNPKQTVSRAIAATMVSKAIDYIEANQIKLQITRFSEYRTYGILSEIGTGNILVKDYKGTLRRIGIPAGAYIKVDGVTASQLLAGHVGKHIAMVWSKDDQSMKGLEVDTKATVVQGAVKAVETETLTKKIYITDLNTGITTGYTLGNNMNVYYQDAGTPITSLKAGSYATVTLQNNTVASVYAYSGSYEKNVTLSSIVFGDPIILTLTEENGDIIELRFKANSIPQIWKGGVVSGADKLRKEDSLKLTVKDCVITRIDAQVKEADAAGTVRRIIKDSTGTTLTVSNSDGVEISYRIAPDVQITQGSRKLTMDSLNVGSKIKFVITDNYITAIEIEELVADNTVITGTVVYKNDIESSFLLSVSDANGGSRYVTVRLSNTAKVLNAKDGSYSQFKSLKIYDIIDVYGTYSGDQYEATIIIVRYSEK